MEETRLEIRQEVETVTTAYFLEDNIARLNEEYKRLQSIRPEEPMPPQEPRRKKSKAAITPYPPVDVKVKFPKILKIAYIVVIIGSPFFIASPLASVWNTVGMILSVSTIIWFLRRGKVKRRKENAVRNSSKYKKQCQEIDAENLRRQEQLDRELQEEYVKNCERYKRSLQQHEEDVRRYHQEILPSWSEEVAALQEALNDTQAALQELYDRRIIPAQYHNIPSLYYLASFMGTSNYDLKYAIERYDMYVVQCQQREQINLQQAQLMVMRDISQNQQYAIWLNEQTIEMLERGNATLNSINSWQKADLALRAYWRYKDRRNRR